MLNIVPRFHARADNKPTKMLGLTDRNVEMEGKGRDRTLGNALLAQSHGKPIKPRAHRDFGAASASANANTDVFLSTFSKYRCEICGG